MPLPNTFRSTVFVAPERSQVPNVLRLSSGVRSGAQTIAFVLPESQKLSNPLFCRANTASRACRSNHYIRSVWKLRSAETITCVASNGFRALEPCVLSSEIHFEAFRRRRFRGKAITKSAYFDNRKSSVPWARIPPTLSVSV